MFRRVLSLWWCGCGANVSTIIVTGHTVVTERGENPAAKAANTDTEGRITGQGQEEKEVLGDERAESNKDVVGHTVNDHHHVDTIQDTTYWYCYSRSPRLRVQCHVPHDLRTDI